MDLIPWAIRVTSLPLNLFAISAVCITQGRNDRVAPFYVNLLIANLCQLCCQVTMRLIPEWTIRLIVSFIFDFTVAVRVSFMLCAALERYLIISRPLRYQSERNIKKTVAVCVLVWVLPAVSVLSFYFLVDFEVLFTVYSTFLLLPLPLLMFFLDRIVKALAASSSVPSAEKHRIAGVLVPELLIYSLLFLPRAVWLLTHGDAYGDTFDKVSLVLIELSPLADVVLYVFMRKGNKDQHLATVCDSDSKTDCKILTVSCSETERKRKEKCGQKYFEQQGRCGLRNPLWFLTQPPVSPPTNDSAQL